MAAGLDDTRLITLQGPRGEGKTLGGLAGCIALGETCLKNPKLAPWLPFRVAVIRDTWTNLERTTLHTFEEAAQMGLGVQLLDGGKQALVDPYLHFFCFGLDNRQDADNLQGFQCAILWPEEVAPAAELTVGIPPEVLAMGILSLRQKGLPKRIVLTFNPPDDDHWVLGVEKFLQESGQEDIRVIHFDIRPGEKDEHFRNMAVLAAQRPDVLGDPKHWLLAAEEFAAYRRRNRLALESIGRTDLVTRLVDGQTGGVALGEAIVPEFKNAHVVKDMPLLIPGSQYYRFWDFGLTPSCVWAQGTPAGNLDILGSRTSINKAMGEHITDEVIPFQIKYGLVKPTVGFARGKRAGIVFRDIGDPAGNKGEETQHHENSAARTIENMLGTVFEPGPVAWEPRRAALQMVFRMQGRLSRERAALVNIWEPENKVLIQGLRGRAHYPVDPRTGLINESIEAAKRVSGLYLQALDALGYGVAVLFPADEWLKTTQRAPVPKSKIPPPRSWRGV